MEDFQGFLDSRSFARERKGNALTIGTDSNVPGIERVVADIYFLPHLSSTLVFLPSMLSM